MPQAILLLGPTASGKTPLGEMLQARGLGTGRCRHFDFGDRLRRIASGQLNVAELAGDDRAFITKVLDHGALLEDEHFGVAEKILRAFLAEQNARPYDQVVLNGLPRHVGQAMALAPHLHWRAVVSLTCAPAILAERLRRDVGGDRASRLDDGPDLIARKLATFAARTVPLVAHYRDLGVPVHELAVGAPTTAPVLHAELQRLLC